MKNLFFLLLCGVTLPSQGQSALTDSAIYAPIKMLFTGMHRGDSAMVHNVFMPKSVMATVGKDDRGNVTLQYFDLRKFLISVGTPHPQAWSEPVWDIKIQSDGSLAQVWAKYAFYVGNNLSHCGVDSFQLFKDADGRWKIFFLVYTRQKEGCQVPSFISESFR